MKSLGLRLKDSAKALSGVERILAVCVLLTVLFFIAAASFCLVEAKDTTKLIEVSVTEFTSDERMATVKLSFEMGTMDEKETMEGVERAMREVIKETSSKELVDRLAEIWSEDFDISSIKTFRVTFEVFRG